VPPSAWLALILPNGFAAAPTIDPSRAIASVMRLFNECVAALDQGEIYAPDPEDEEGCAAFAAGYADGAALDPAWRDDADRWTFASHLAHLGGRLHLVPAETKAKIEAEEVSR